MDTRLESSQSLFFLIGGVANAGIVWYFEIFSLSQECVHRGSYILSAVANYKNGGVGPVKKKHRAKCWCWLQKSRGF